MFPSRTYQLADLNDTPHKARINDYRLKKYYARLMVVIEDEPSFEENAVMEPRTKGWLFDTLVTPTLMYAAPVWAPSLTQSSWTQVERPQVIMLSRLIRGKPSVPRDIIRAELAAPPMLVEALFQTVCFIQRVCKLPQDRLSYRALEASRQLAVCYTRWFSIHGLDIEELPPFQYDPDSPLIRLSHKERNRVLKQSLATIYQGDMNHTETASSTEDVVLQGSVHDYYKRRFHPEA
ncbi:hypothetical protein L7F22_064803 [Adiantum nelumboides]|nr:hypothetical protein [Adiantum nelumboides]